MNFLDISDPYWKRNPDIVADESFAARYVSNDYDDDYYDEEDVFYGNEYEDF